MGNIFRGDPSKSKQQRFPRTLYISLPERLSGKRNVQGSQLGNIATQSSISGGLKGYEVELTEWIAHQINEGILELSTLSGGAALTVEATELDLTGTNVDINATNLDVIATTTAIGGSLRLVNEAEGRTGSLNYLTAREVHTLTLGATSDTTTISIPVGAVVLGASFTVNTAVTTSGATNTWSAAFITGSTTALATGAAGALNTKVNTLIVPEVTAGGIAQIRFDAAGVETFATGVIEVVVYYQTLTSLANA